MDCREGKRDEDREGFRVGREGAIWSEKIFLVEEFLEFIRELNN